MYSLVPEAFRCASTKARHRLPNGVLHSFDSNMAASMVRNGNEHKWACHGLISCVTIDFLWLIARYRPQDMCDAWFSKWFTWLIQFYLLVLEQVDGSIPYINSHISHACKIQFKAVTSLSIPLIGFIVLMVKISINLDRWHAPVFLF
jgi:hypothetical protein